MTKKATLIPHLHQLFIILSLLVFWGCTKSHHKRSDKVLSIALESAPSSLDPLKATDATGMRTVSLIYQSLVRVGKNLKPQGDLASKWEVNNNVYKFFISSEIKFSDGTPLVCQDLTESIKSYQSDRTPFKGTFKPIKEVSCQKQDSFLILNFKHPAMPEKFLLADLPVLKIFKDSLGTGPFVLSENKPNFSLLKPNPYYTQPQSYDLQLQYLKDDFSRFLKMYKGEIDIAPNSIPFEKISSFENSLFKVLETPSLSTSYLLVNFKTTALQNLDLRKKIYQIIDVPSLVKNRFDDHVTLAKSLMSPDHPYFAQNLKTTSISSHAPKTSAPILKLKTSNSRQSRETGKILAQSLRAGGIPVVLQSFEWGTYYKDVKQGNFDLALMKWVGVVDPDLYNIAFHSSEFPPGRNRGYYQNAEVDKMLDDAKLIQNGLARKQAYDKIQTFLYNNLAILPLWHENQIHIVHPRVQGYEVNPMGDFYSFLNLKIQTQGDKL